MLRFSIGATDPVWGELMKQITRLEQLDRFPFGPEAKKDLGAALAHADSLDEARLAIDEFVQGARAGEKCPLSGDILALLEARKLRANPEPHVIFEEPQPVNGNCCKRCGGHGIYGGQVAGSYAGPWKWCDCPAARERQTKEPHVVDEANRAREKLLALGGKPALPTIPAAGDEYRGEF